ncbi:MAG: LysM peptidoglycan-binding domain-containing protein [Treponema sp.]|nr:LysM peptidoglycan-binding domain-containing protein [Treponema sp.]
MKCLIHNIFIFFLLFVTGISFTSASEDERPIRSVAPNPVQISNSPLLDSYTFKPAVNSLLTEKALEQPLTRQYIAQYSSPHGIATLNAVLNRASIYMPFIKEEIEKRGLPPELAYLPIIESGFQITARSRSGAMGLWQFMMNSISPYGMKVSDLIDERRDFIKSTRGALQKLEDEYKRLGCWELTLAAYNSGLNAVTRIIQRTGKNDYWELSSKKEFRPETVNFVPRLIAVSYVVSQPRRFGINAWHEKFEWIDIPLNRQVSVDIIAGETGIDKNLLRSLNAELIHGISPADSAYRLKIPSSQFDVITALLEREDLPLIRYYYHIVRTGDTLWSMSRNYGTSVSMIEQHNAGISSRYLKIGETVIIPAFNDVTPVRQTAVSVQGYNGTHRVQSGDTFWSLSRIYGIDVQALADANNMKLTDILHIGKILRLPILE